MDDTELEMGGFDHNCIQSHTVYGDFGVLIMLEGSMTFTICNSCPQTQVGWGAVIFQLNLTFGVLPVHLLCHPCDSNKYGHPHGTVWGQYASEVSFSHLHLNSGEITACGRHRRQWVLYFSCSW
jgi:hypothetical protein